MVKAKVFNRFSTGFPPFFNNKQSGPKTALSHNQKCTDVRWLLFTYL